MIAVNPLILHTLAAVFLGLLLLGLVFFGKALERRGVRKDTLINLAMYVLIPFLVITLGIAASLRMWNRTSDEGQGGSEVVEEAAPRDQ